MYLSRYMHSDIHNKLILSCDLSSELHKFASAHCTCIIDLLRSICGENFIVPFIVECEELTNLSTTWAAL